MKKFLILAILVTFILGVSPSLNAQSRNCVSKISLSVGAGIRNFSSSLYKDVYGDSPTTYNADLGFRLSNIFEAFVHTDYLKVDGQTTYTHDTTTLKILPAEVGLRLLLPVTKGCKFVILPYLGGGAGYYMIKEESAIGTVDEKRTGFFFEGGLRIYIMKPVFIDLKAKDVMLKSKSDVNLGGFTYQGGIGISF